MATKKTSKGKIVAEVGAGLLAAGAAGYYLYGSKNAKKNRKAVVKEVKADWKMLQSEGKKVIAQGKRTAKKVTKKAVKKVVKKVIKKIAKARKSR
ncbi:MAG: hypothetical protein WCS97_02510 [Candidatus Paceibacterota bacterium]|jgi:hypothetical protein